MPDFRPRPGTRKTFYKLKHPIADITAFDGIVRSLVFDNPLGCSPRNEHKKVYPPVQKVREIYTAKFEYRNDKGKRIGTTTETYDSVEGYGTGIAAVISNMANIFSHRGRLKHLPESDLFSVMLRCYDRSGELYLLHLARDRMTLLSYSNEQIRETVERWMGTVPALA